jgi:hypothetical protein
MFRSITNSTSKNLSAGGELTGDVTITGDLSVTGSSSITVNEVIQGTSTIDVDSTEALLVRKNGDAGDVFVVDTTNSRVGVGVTPTSPLHIKSLINNTFSDTISATDFTGDVLTIENRPASSNDDYVSIAMATSGSQFVSSRIVLDNDGSGAGALNFQLRSPGDLSNTTTFMKIKSTGDVEVPSGNILASGASAPSITATDTTNTTSIQMRALDSEVRFGSVTNHPVKIGANSSTTGLVIDTSNNVGIGITPTVDLDISSPSGDVQARLFRNANVKTSLTFKNSLQEWEIGNSVGDNNKFTIRDITDSRNAFVIDGSGDASFSGDITITGGDIFSANLGLQTTNGTGTIFLSGNTTINDAGHDVDFRVESDGNANMLFVDGGNNRVGIGGTPTRKLSVFGSAYTEAGGADSNIFFSVANSSWSGMALLGGTSQGGFIDFGDTDAVHRGRILYSHASDNMQFNTSAVTRLILDANSRISLSNNDGGGTGGNASSSANTLLGYGIGDMDTGSISNTLIGHRVAGNGSHDDMTNNTGVGNLALFYVSSGDNNTALGSVALHSLNTGSNNVAIGKSAGENITSGGNSVMIGNEAGQGVSTSFYHVLIGDNAGNKTLSDHGTVAVGYYALANATTGGYNTAIGYQSLEDNVSGEFNTAVGYQTLKDATGQRNSVLGYQALFSTTTAGNSVAVGRQAGYSVSDHGNNVYIGDASGYHQTGESNVFIGKDAGLGASGSDNDGTVAIGFKSLESLTSGTGNTAVGFESLKANQTGTHNTAFGNVALDACTGSSNTAVGFGALGSVVGGGTNIGIGSGAGNKGGGSGADLTTGNNNTLIGNVTRVSTSGADNQTVIGYDAIGQADNSVTLGNGDVTDVYMAQDSGATVHCARVEVEGNISNDFVGQFENDGNSANRYGLQVVAGADDASGTTFYLNCKDGDGDSVGFIANTSGTFALTDVSDQRLKKNIVDTSIKGLEKINQLKVRDFDWKKSQEKSVGGFIAQEVKDVFPQAVIETNTTVDGEENIMGVSRDMLVPLLIKAVQELSAKVEELEKK